MALTELTDKILEDAKQQAEHIRSAAEDEVARIKREAETAHARMKEEHKAELARTLADNEARVTGSAEKEVKTQVDAAKRALVDQVFSEALASLRDLSDDDYAAFILPYFKELPRDAKGTLTVPAVREDVSKKLAKDAELSLEIKTSNDFFGGFVFAAEDVEYTCTFETILAGKKEELEAEVARILFS